MNKQLSNQEKIRFVRDDIRHLTQQIAALQADLTLKRIALTELQSDVHKGELFRYHGRKRYYQKKIFQVVGFHEDGPVMCYLMADGQWSKRIVIMHNKREWAHVGQHALAQ